MSWSGSEGRRRQRLGRWRQGTPPPPLHNRYPGIRRPTRSRPSALLNEHPTGANILGWATPDTRRLDRQPATKTSNESKGRRLSSRCPAGAGNGRRDRLAKCRTAWSFRMIPRMRPDKYTVIICDDSRTERMRFYRRQFDNFIIYGVRKEGSDFIEDIVFDSPNVLYRVLTGLRRDGNLPSIVLLDLFYKRDLPDSDQIEQDAIREIVQLKDTFRAVRAKVLSYLSPDGMTLLRRIRLADKVSKVELPILVYTDKDFNFLPPSDFNSLYELDSGFAYKDRDDLELRSTIPVPVEYFRIVSAIEAAQAARRPPRVFMSHGHSDDWECVQRYIRDDLGIECIEFNQVASKSRTTIQHLHEVAAECSFAIILMTGDDAVGGGEYRARENVVHEIGYFQGRYDLDRVCILHERGTTLPSNIYGITTIGYAAGQVEKTFAKLTMELRAANLLPTIDGGNRWFDA